MKKIICFIILIASSLVLAAEQNLLLTGSSTIAPIILDIAQSFEKKYKQTTVEVQTGGSTRGLLDVKRGLSQIGMVSRALKPAELKSVKAKTLAIDGLGFILHKSNPVSGLSQQQLLQIYTGKITRWSQIGGVDKEITVVHKAEGRSTLDLFLDYLQIKNSKIKPSIIIGDNEQGIKTVVSNPYAIGYVSVGSASYNIKSGLPLKLIALDGVPANNKNIVNQTYPIVRTLNLVYKDEFNALLYKLLRFIESKEAQAILKKHYVISPK